MKHIIPQRFYFFERGDFATSVLWCCECSRPFLPMNLEIKRDKIPFFVGLDDVRQFSELVDFNTFTFGIRRALYVRPFKDARTNVFPKGVLLDYEWVRHAAAITFRKARKGLLLYMERLRV